MAIAWCQAMGIYGKMWQDVIHKTKSQMIPNTRSSKIRALEPLFLEQLIPPFIMIAIGFALSAITFCSEKYHQRRTLREKWGFLQRKQENEIRRITVRAVSPKTTHKINMTGKGSGVNLEARTLNNVKVRKGRKVRKMKLNSPSQENEVAKLYVE